MVVKERSWKTARQRQGEYKEDDEVAQECQSEKEIQSAVDDLQIENSDVKDVKKKRGRRNPLKTNKQKIRTPPD
jgi:hypothetical protein